MIMILMFIVYIIQNILNYKDLKLDHYRLEKKLGITYDKILEIFFNKEYFCYMTGFIAGMPFLGDINEKLRAKRLETPRVKVPKG